MNTNATLLVIGALVITGGLAYFASGIGGDGRVAQSASSLIAEETFHDFGDIPIFGGVVTTDFTLTNEGDEDIVIESGTTSCGCTTATIGGMRFGMHEDITRPYTIPPGRSETLTVIYDPLAHGPSGVGLAERSVYLKTNSLKTPELEMRVRAMVMNNES